MENQKNPAELPFAWRRMRGLGGEHFVIFDAADSDLASGLRPATDKWPIVVLAALPDGGLARLSRLVAARRCPQPSPAHNCVGHRNGNTLDCRAANLYWATYRQLVGTGNRALRREMMTGKEAVRIAR